MSGARDPLHAALTQQPWTYTAVVLGLDHIHDVNGRPLGERRAPAEARRDVPLELVACPYRDERKGRLMNRSALEPTVRALPEVAADVAAVHVALPADLTGWPRMLAVVLDQLAAPARFLLDARRDDVKVPALLAAAHKLAAGYFGALRALLRDLAAELGPAAECSAAGFLSYVRERGSLIGASEVCAGTPRHIELLTRLFVGGAQELGAAADSARRASLVPGRLALAQLVASQVQLGIEWSVFDELVERELLVEAHARGQLRPRTAFLADRLAERVAELEARPCPGSRLRGAPDEAATAAEAEIVHQLLGYDDAALRLDPELRVRYAQRFADAIARYRRLIAEQERLEREVRGALGYPVELEVPLNPLLCPRPRSLEWLEAFSGHRLQRRAAPREHLVLRNHRRTVVFA
ncbi:MAG: hypothetical protein R3B48_23790 [Kofleriaceae bacterium]